jgi:type II secretory pathway component GspD/PulD (secretin)
MSAPVSVPAIRPNVQGTASQGGTDALVSDLVKIYADEILNAIIILGTPEDYEVIKGTITKLDIVPRQVLIEGTIASIQLTDKMSLGLAWSIKNNIFNMDAFTISMNPTSLNIDTTKANPGSSGLNMIGIDSGGSVRAVINALASQSKAKLLASPHIMVSIIVKQGYKSDNRFQFPLRKHMVLPLSAEQPELFNIKISVLFSKSSRRLMTAALLLCK